MGKGSVVMAPETNVDVSPGVGAGIDSGRPRNLLGLRFGVDIAV